METNSRIFKLHHVLCSVVKRSQSFKDESPTPAKWGLDMCDTCIVATDY